MAQLTRVLLKRIEDLERALRITTDELQTAANKLPFNATFYGVLGTSRAVLNNRAEVTNALADAIPVEAE